MIAGEVGSDFPISRFLGLPYPIRNMLRRWRSLLGMIAGVGIALGIGMTLLGVSSAELELFTGDFRRSGADLYVVTQGGNLVPILPGDTPGTIKDARQTLSRIRSFPEVAAALGVLSWTMERERPGPRRGDAPAELFSVMGVEGDPTLIPDALDLQQGRWLRRPHEVVVGSRLSREKAIGLGDDIRLNGRDFIVTGIGKLRGFGLFSADALVYMEYHAFRQQTDLGDVVSIVAIETARPEEVRQRVQELGALSATTVDELVEQARAVSAAGVVIYWILITLTLSIAALFVSTVLSRSVAERRMEFATLRAIGVPSRTILLTVSAEAVLVSATASLVAVAMSLVLGGLLTWYVAPLYGIESLYAVDAGLFLVVFLMALGLGVISGLSPARQATRVDPVEVLREA